jgi:hypothetical protein
MGSFSNYLENEILDHIFGCTSRNYTSPTNIFVALSTSDPGEAGSGIAEPAGGSYARASTDGADWNTAGSGSVTNAADIAFATATLSWGTITHFALFDLVTGGNMLAYGSLSLSKAVGAGDTAKFVTGDLAITLD